MFIDFKASTRPFWDDRVPEWSGLYILHGKSHTRDTRTVIAPKSMDEILQLTPKSRQISKWHLLAVSGCMPVISSGTFPTFPTYHSAGGALDGGGGGENLQ